MISPSKQASAILRWRFFGVVLRACIFALLLFIFISPRTARRQDTVPAGKKVASGLSRSQIAIGIQDLSEPLRDLSPSDERVLDEAIDLIKRKKHLMALEILTTLISSNPANSTPHILRAYALLELGDVAGALGDASAAEASGPARAYKCWFLARVAYLAGDKPLCRREIKHLRGQRTYGQQAEDLLQQLDGGPNAIIR
jgi:hypothetical protein